MSDQELISRIMTDVKDEALRDKLLTAVVSKETQNSPDGNILTSIGLQPDAITKNLGMGRTIGKIILASFFLVGAGMLALNLLLRDLFGVAMGGAFMVGSVVTFFGSEKSYRNLLGK